MYQKICDFQVREAEGPIGCGIDHRYDSQHPLPIHPGPAHGGGPRREVEVRIEIAEFDNICIN